MSSHREAPEISKDPVADSTDACAFVSPDQPDTVTLISSYIPLQGSGGGPNFYEFGDDVRYEIHIDNNGDAKPDVTYRFEFTTEVRNQRTSSTTPARSTAWTTPTGPSAGILGDEAGRGRAAAGARQPGAVPPCNIGPRSTPDYADLASQPSGPSRPVRTSSPASVNASAQLNVHAIAIQVPINDLTTNGRTPGRSDGCRGFDRRLRLRQQAEDPGLRR